MTARTQRKQGILRQVTSSRPCPSEQEISTILLGEDEVLSDVSKLWEF